MKTLIVNLTTALALTFLGSPVFAADVNSLDSIIEEAQAGDIEQALIDVDLFIADHPRDDEAHLLKSELLYSNRENLLSVISEIQRAIELNPTNVRHWLAKAEVDKAMNDYRAALTDYDQIMTLDPSDINTLALRYQLHLELDQTEAALEDAKLAVQLQPDNAGLYVVMAELYQNLNDDANAVAVLEKAVALYTAQSDQENAGIVANMLEELKKTLG